MIKVHTQWFNICCLLYALQITTYFRAFSAKCESFCKVRHFIPGKITEKVLQTFQKEVTNKNADEKNSPAVNMFIVKVSYLLQQSILYHWINSAVETLIQRFLEDFFELIKRQRQHFSYQAPCYQTFESYFWPTILSIQPTFPSHLQTPTQRSYSMIFATEFRRPRRNIECNLGSTPKSFRLKCLVIYSDAF